MMAALKTEGLLAWGLTIQSCVVLYLCWVLYRLTK